MTNKKLFKLAKSLFPFINLRDTYNEAAEIAMIELHLNHQDAHEVASLALDLLYDLYEKDEKLSQIS